MTRLPLKLYATRAKRHKNKFSNFLMIVENLPIASSTALFSSALSMVSRCMPAALHAFFACTQFALKIFNLVSFISHLWGENIFNFCIFYSCSWNLIGSISKVESHIWNTCICKWEKYYWGCVFNAKNIKIYYVLLLIDPELFWHPLIERAMDALSSVGKIQKSPSKIIFVHLLFDLSPQEEILRRRMISC